MNSSRVLAALAAAATLSACSTVRAINPFDDAPKKAARQADAEGRISILTFEQRLETDPKLAGRVPAIPAPAEAPDWSQPGGEADNSPLHGAFSADPKIAWREKAGPGASKRQRAAAPPVVAGGKLFVMDAELEVHAYDAGSGRTLWSKPLRARKARDGAAIGGGVATGDGKVFATSGYGSIVAFDAVTGAEAWRADLPAPFHAAPTFSGGRVFAVTNDSELIAFDAANGQVLWTHQAIAEPARILAASSPAVVGDMVIAPFASGEVVALLTANGRRLWVDALTRAGRLTSLSAINDIAGRPVVSDGVVYAVSHSGVLAAIDQRTGQRVWARGVSSTQTPWVAGDTLFILSVDGELAALEKTTGSVFWVKQLRRYTEEDDKRGRISWSGPILAGGHLVLASSEGDLVLMAADTGEQTRSLKLGGPVFVPPIAAGGMVYVITDEGRIIALR